MIMMMMKRMSTATVYIQVDELECDWPWSSTNKLLED